MSSNYIIPVDGLGEIIEFDVITDILHERISRPTGHPVEEGATVSDHVHINPHYLSLVAYVSNTPIQADIIRNRGIITKTDIEISKFDSTSLPVFANTLVFPIRFDAIKEKWDRLVELQEQASLLQIVTSLTTYDDMIIVRVSAPKTAGSDAVQFSIDVQRMRVVSSGLVVAPPIPADDVPGGKPLQNKGAQGSKDPKADQKKPGSIAYRILNSQGLL